MTSTREFDHRQERVVNDFLVKYFFNKQFSSVEVVTDRERQQRGIDIIADKHCIDIKAQSSPAYLNKPTNTFILELSFLLTTGKEVRGWFLQHDMLTDWYAFVWIHESHDHDGKLLTLEDITNVEVMLVDKRSMKKHINSTLKDRELRHKAYIMRKFGKRWKECDIDGLHLSHTMHLLEKPVNLVAQKEFLKKFSVGHYIVTKNFVKTFDEVVDKSDEE